jgi:hypothetical protein
MLSRSALCPCRHQPRDTYDQLGRSWGLTAVALYHLRHRRGPDVGSEETDGRGMAAPTGTAAPQGAEQAPPATSPTLPDRLRDALRSRHYSRRTGDTYCHRVKRFVYFHHVRHPAPEGRAGDAPCRAYITLKPLSLYSPVLVRCMDGVRRKSVKD